MALSLNSSDEWILRAIRSASRPNGATLTDIIAAADMSEQAILTIGELRSGFGKLLAARYVREDGGRWFVNERDRASDLPDPVPDYPLTPEVYEAAVKRYLDRTSS